MYFCNRLIYIIIVVDAVALEVHPAHIFKLTTISFLSVSRVRIIFFLECHKIYKPFANGPNNKAFFLLQRKDKKVAAIKLIRSWNFDKSF